MSTSTMLSVPDLEQVYDALATAIDTAGPEKSELFLVKLALLTANAQGDADGFTAQNAAAPKAPYGGVAGGENIKSGAIPLRIPLYQRVFFA